MDPTLRIPRCGCRGEAKEGGREEGKGGGSGWEGGEEVFFWTHELQVWLAQGSGATVATSVTQEMRYALHISPPPEDHTRYPGWLTQVCWETHARLLAVLDLAKIPKTKQNKNGRKKTQHLSKGKQINCGLSTQQNPTY